MNKYGKPLVRIINYSSEELMEGTIPFSDEETDDQWTRAKDFEDWEDEDDSSSTSSYWRK